MILHRIVAANVGPFVGPPVTAGPFVPGLNILSAPNETGKTTLLKAAGRALFDRHTCKADEIKNLRPAGTSLSPAVTVDFETADGRFQIEKTFLQGPRSQLSQQHVGQWQLVADGDSADDRLNALLRSTKPGRGATDAAHWGMLGYLWMRQGELAEWPDWREAPTGQVVRGMLVKLEIDPFIESVRGRMWSVFTENFTPATNQPRAGGTLLAAEAELARVEAELAGIARTRQQLQTDQEAYDRLADELPRLAAESARCREAAHALREAGTAARVLQVEVDKNRAALATARDRLKAVQQDRDLLRDHAHRSGRLAAQLQAANEEAARRADEGASARERLRAAEVAREENARLLAAAQVELTRAGRRVRHRRLSEDVARAGQALERSAAASAALDRLTAARAELPTVPPAKLTRLETLHESIVANRVRLQALGLTVELTPAAAPASVTVRADDAPSVQGPAIPAGDTGTFHAAQSLVLELPGWGAVRLRSGAGEASALRRTLSGDEETLRELLAALGAATLAEARALAGRARDLDREIAAARQVLTAGTGQADDTPDTLRARLARDRRQLELLAAEIRSALPPGTELQEVGGASRVPPVDSPCLPDSLSSAADLDAAEQTATVLCENYRAEAKMLDRRLEELRAAVATSSESLHGAERAVLLLRSEGDNLQRTVAALRTRYPRGLEEAVQDALEDFAVGTHALKTAEEKLPPDLGTLPERDRRAAAAAGEVSLLLDRRRGEQAELRGRLELGGSSGLHGREGALRVQCEALRLQATQSRARSRAARLVHDLIERRKEAATRAVLAPLQERLGARFAEVSGERDRRIFLDESLTVRGLGRKDGDLVPFGELSQGAKEQLLLCLRLAIAEELVAGGGGPQSLILDDVLVNTDAARQERILTLLTNAAAHGLQILVCTCHPDRYRGVGTVVTLHRN